MADDEGRISPPQSPVMSRRRTGNPLSLDWHHAVGRNIQNRTDATELFPANLMCCVRDPRICSISLFGSLGLEFQLTSLTDAGQASPLWSSCMPPISLDELTNTTTNGTMLATLPAELGGMHVESLHGLERSGARDGSTSLAVTMQLFGVWMLSWSWRMARRSDERKLVSMVRENTAPCRNRRRDIGHRFRAGIGPKPCGQGLLHPRQRFCRGWRLGCVQPRISRRQPDFHSQSSVFLGIAETAHGETRELAADAWRVSLACL